MQMSLLILSIYMSIVKLLCQRASLLKLFEPFVTGSVLTYEERVYEFRYHNDQFSYTLKNL